MKKILIVAAVAAMVAACCHKAVRHHPEWTYDSVMYEVNVRQFSPEGTFKGVEAQLPRLKELGVDILWLMPMYEIGTVERKGSLGSYYAISEYLKVNPEFGTMQDFDELLAAAHAQGFKVILDWVANQTAPDHIWMEGRPAEFYERDSLGNAIWEYDWTDTRSLNYDNEAVWAAQDSCMRFWLDKGVDGFRCDAAGEMPAAFWQSVMPGLKADYPEAYFLAEAEKPELSDPDSTFDATYAWELHHIMNGVAQGKKTVADIKDYLVRDETEKTPPTAFRLSFTSNHDENSWAGTEFERMGPAANAMAVLCFTLPKTQPLIYTGQEIGLDRRLAFFEKDPITSWEANSYTEFFKKLVDLKHNHPALDAGERGGKIEYLDPQEFDIPAPESVLAFTRSAGKDKVYVIVNLSGEEASVPVELGEEYHDIFTGTPVVGSNYLPIGPWGYMVLAK